MNKKEKKLLELKEELEKRGISISSVHAPFGEENDLSSPSFRIRKKTINQHIVVMKQMDIIKTPVLTIHPGSRVDKEEDIPLKRRTFQKEFRNTS